MKYSKNIIWIAFLSILGHIPSAYANSGNNDTPVSISVATKVNYVMPTCNVNVAPTFDLGLLTKGPVKTHPELAISIDCIEVLGAFTSLTAISSANTVPSTMHKLQLMNDNNHAWLSLSDYGSGTDVDINFDNSTTFCRANQSSLTRTCYLKVRTQIEPANIMVGKFSVPVTFSLIYL